MIKVGKMNESIGMTQSDWKEVRPEDYDEGQVEGYIKNFDDAAKVLKCRAQDLVNITEDDGEAYNKIIRLIKKGDKGQKVKMPSVDGLANLYTLTNGCTVVTTNEWGYGTVFVKKSEVKKAMNESAQPINEAASNEKDIAKLKKMYARQLEIQDFIFKNGFEAAMKYKDEYHKLLGDIGKLAQKIDGPGAIHGKGILYQIDKELNESLEMNESAKISKMTKADGQGYSGVWQLPSGTPGLYAVAGDTELAVIGDAEGIQIILQDEDGDWFKYYSADKEKDAVTEFKKIAAQVTDLTSASKLAKKFGLESM